MIKDILSNSFNVNINKITSVVSEVISNSFNININKEGIAPPTLNEVISNSFNLNINKESVNPPTIVEVISNTFNININKESGVDLPPVINTVSDVSAIVNKECQILYVATDDKGISKHELSLNDGQNYNEINPVKSGNTYAYRITCSSVGEVICKIRLTDTNNQTSISNSFKIKVTEDDVNENSPELGINGKANTSVEVYRGSIKLVGTDKEVPGENEFRYEIASSNGCVVKKKNADTLYIESMSSDSATVNVNINAENKMNFTKVMSLTKTFKVDEEELKTVMVTITGQNTMKYLDKYTPPIPSTATLTSTVQDGKTVVTSGLTYLWQYKKADDNWYSLSGTNNQSKYSLSHDNNAFIDEVAQIKVDVVYKGKTHSSEFTVTKMYDNKYIDHEEIFDKLTDGGKHQLIYKDDITGDIYINATYIKSGQLVADLIKGGILTLGGQISANDEPVNGYMRVLDVNNKEQAILNGGDMVINGLSCDEASIDKLYINNIESPKIVSSVMENTTLYVNKNTGSDDAKFDNGSKFKTIQAAIDSVPKNINGLTVSIRIENTRTDGTPDTYSEDLTIRGFYGGTFNLYLQRNWIHGNVRMQDSSARIFILGGSSIDDIADGLERTERGNIKPSNLIDVGGNYYSMVALGCQFVYVRAIDIWGKTGSASNFCVGARDGSNMFVKNMKVHSSGSGFHAQTMGRLTTDETYGKVETYAYRCTYGGWMNISSGSATSGSINMSTGDGCQILQGTIDWDGQSDVGNNDNTTSNSGSTTLTSTSGDSYKVKYSSWRKDNTVRQGDWSGTGLNKGCWFFGNQFEELKGKTIKSVKLTLTRQSSGGSSGAVSFTLKMHNYSSRPSSSPSYLSSWTKSVSLAWGASTTITITDSAVLSAIANGTMKGFGIETSSTSNSYYGILTPNLKAVVTYN